MPIDGWHEFVFITRLRDQVKRHSPISTSPLAIPVPRASLSLAVAFRNNIVIVVQTRSRRPDSAFKFCYQLYLGPTAPAYGTSSPLCPVIDVTSAASDDTCMKDHGYC